MQCTLVYTEDIVQSIFLYQIYPYSRSKPLSLYAENILSTMLERMIQHCGVHWSIRSTLSRLYLFTRSIHILELNLCHCFRKYLKYTDKKPDTIPYCSIHWCIWSTLSSVYLFTKSIHILDCNLYQCTLKIS